MPKAEVHMQVAFSLDVPQSETEHYVVQDSFQPYSICYFPFSLKHGHTKPQAGWATNSNSVLTHHGMLKYNQNGSNIKPLQSTSQEQIRSVTPGLSPRVTLKRKWHTTADAQMHNTAIVPLESVPRGGENSLKLSRERTLSSGLKVGPEIRSQRSRDMRHGMYIKSPHWAMRTWATGTAQRTGCQAERTVNMPWVCLHPRHYFPIVTHGLAPHNTVCLSCSSIIVKPRKFLWEHLPFNLLTQVPSWHHILQR